MSNVATLIDTNVESMDKMGGEILKMASVLPAPIEELTASLYDIRSAGVSADNAMKVLEASGRLAASGLATTSESTNMMTSAINAFKNEGLEAAEISDILFKTVKFGKTNISQLAQAFGATAPIVQSAGVRLADFSAATAALTTVGTPAAQAQNQIRASIIALQKLSTSTPGRR
jgi:TP901 family phage tail tape measure protein